MRQGERDRLVALKKAKTKLITQKEAAKKLGITERHVRRLLRQVIASCQICSSYRKLPWRRFVRRCHTPMTHPQDVSNRQMLDRE